MDIFGIHVPANALVPGVLLGFFAWFVLRHVIMGFFTVDQNERAVKTSFGRAHRLANASTVDLPISEVLTPDEKKRYAFPQVRVIGPGGPYFKWPWQKVYKVSVATQTINMAKDLETPSANQDGTILEAVTKDQLNTGLTGDIRFRVSDQNLYAFLFGVKNPIVHVMGYFISVLRQKIASYMAPSAKDGKSLAPGLMGDTSSAFYISINDLRKNLRDINDFMEMECSSSNARYGIVLEASLITGIDPPAEVESALAAINTAHNQVSSDISLAQAAADQKIVQSQRAVEIETLRAQAEVQPLLAMETQLKTLKGYGPEVLNAYRRFINIDLLSKADQVIQEVRK